MKSPRSFMFQTRSPGNWLQLLTWIGVGLWIWGSCFLSFQAAEPLPEKVTLKTLPITTNIHHQPQYCHLCHESGTKESPSFQVRPRAGLTVNCRCHYEDPGDLRHPTDGAMPEAMRSKMPASFPLPDARMTCVTCHSFAILCAKENPGISSLRGGPYQERFAFCYRCHDETQYERLNPHQQLDASGKIIEEKCLFCHTQKPDETKATYPSIHLVGRVEMLCQGCHNISMLHPAGKPHMVRPTLEYQARMRRLEKQYGIILPLDEKGKLTCITCHNPHEAGVIPSTLAGAQGADQKLRHRLPKVLCEECHWHPLSKPK